MKISKIFPAQGYTVLTLAMVLAAPCAVTAQEADTPAQADTPIADNLTDGQILQVIRVLSEGEIRQAEMAMDQSGNDEVKNAAQIIINDHTNTSEQIDSLAGSDLPLEDSTLSDGLQSLAEVTMENLASLDGMAFDCQYLREQANQHQLALDTLNSHLLPNAQDRKVKEFLAMTSPSLEHLLHTAREGIENIGQCSQG